ncbi:MAG TPA: pyridoxamine 5'-phosphate oxidase [Methylomirabilota bacterium]
MLTWIDFARAEPEMAAAGAALLNQFGVGLAFLATVDGRGAPRLHPVCPVLSARGLHVLITATSPKCGDLARDGRYALQTFPQPKPGSDEFYVAGRARPVEEDAPRARILAAAKHMADTSEAVFELLVDRVMHTRWEEPLTPRMRPTRRVWRTDRSARA